MKKAYQIFKDKFGIVISTKLGGKMNGVHALSTSAKVNPICKKRAKDKTNICHYCYAMRIMNGRPSVRKCYERNFEALQKLLPYEVLPIITEDIFRFEAFGDLASKIQALNYVNIARKNPNTTFALWTKNPIFLYEALKEVHKPKNLIVIQSSSHVNVVDKPLYDFIDKVFTVYTEDYIKANGIDINCGARSCRTCQRCYRHTDSVEYVNEKLK